MSEMVSIYYIPVSMPKLGGDGSPMVPVPLIGDLFCNGVNSARQVHGFA